ncbi:MAG TPA: Rrf2 family transcriptional regulator [Rhodopila sp.]|jgi:Rrf2 family nitric oxide-sensitive transcriptional repressor|nr:Rrf2 family transcriptional regulator [Rhodopila sp.]
MRLTTYTDYSLRTMMYLAVKSERLATIADISSAYGISENHLMKIVHQLGQAGFIETVRGRRGGLRLARPPDQINLGVIVRKMEPDLEIAPCFGQVDSCAIAPCCGLQHVLKEALEAFLEILDRYTLADLIRSPIQLAALLDVASEGRKHDVATATR